MNFQLTQKGKTMKHLIVSNTITIIVVLFFTMSTSRVDAEILNVNSGIFYPTITQAITSASSGNRLNISTGVYSEAIKIISTELEMYGGYATDCATKISGGMSYIAPHNGPYIWNSKVFFDSICVTGSVSFGLNIRGGSVVTSRFCNFSHNRSITYGNGGGVCVRQNSRLVLDRCSLYKNDAVNFGGGASIESNSKLTLIGDSNDISENTAKNGGGIAVIDGGIFQIQGVANIQKNSASVNGGGIYCDDSGESTVGNSEIVENIAGKDGGGFYVRGAGTKINLKNVNVISNLAKSISKVTNIGGGGLAAGFGAEVDLVNCLFDSNVSSNHAGAIAIYASQLTMGSDFTTFPSLTQPPNRFFNNSAPNDRQGGAVLITSESGASIKDAIFTNNFAGGYGGAVYVYNSATCDFVNVVIARNSSEDYGDGIRASVDSALRMAYCTVADNDEDGVTTGSSSLAMTNCIVWGHSLTEVDGGEDVQYSDIEGGYATGTGNIDANPVFISGTYELTAVSPCVNTGINVNIEYDCIGESRPQLGGYDLGAYEAIPEPGLGIWIFGIFILFLKNKIKIITGGWSV